MVTVIRQGSPKSKINDILKKLFERKGKKGIDAQKYCGVIKLEEDALTIQKRMRDEW